MLSRTQLRQFLAVVDTGSFSRAANQLNIAQPSLSGGIAELERGLGTRLFVRERRRIRLTEAGNLLLPLARGIERDFHAVETRIGNLPAPVRPIRLGLLDTLGAVWLERQLGCYRGDDPLELSDGNERELATALRSGAIDAALTLLPSGDGKPLLDEEYCLILPVNHRLADRSQVGPEEVAGETMLARRSCEMLAETSRYFTDHGVRPRFLLRSANDERVLALIRAGLGVTVAPRSCADGGGLVAVSLADFGKRRRIGLIFGADWADQFGANHGLAKNFGEMRTLPADR